MSLLTESGASFEEALKRIGEHTDADCAVAFGAFDTGIDRDTMEKMQIMSQEIMDTGKTFRFFERHLTTDMPDPAKELMAMAIEHVVREWRKENLAPPTPERE